MVEVIFIALALSADAFAVSVGSSPHVKTKKSTFLLIGYFSIFHAVMPALGYLLGLGVLKWIEQYANWFGFVLLICIGIKMIYDSMVDLKSNSRPTSSTFTLSHLEILTLSFATSIDALAVGSTLAILSAHPFFSCLLIGGVTGIISYIGLSIGHKSSAVFKDKAGIFGGTILIIFAFRILFV